MKTYRDCIPCFDRQALEAARLTGASQEAQKVILGEVIEAVKHLSMDMSPPEIAKTVYGIVDKHTGGVDAYRHLKEKSNLLALDLYPGLKRDVLASDDSLLSAVRLAVAGNVIDYGVSHVFSIEDEIEECLEKDFAVFDYDEFCRAIKKADNILYILDNAGEIVFDKLLVETISHPALVCAVRGKPIINDVTMEDALQVGLDKVAKVISSGSEIPGTVIKNCTEEFLEYYNNADMVISKGQGNFETLADESKNIFFIFKAKCPVVARHLGCHIGDIILKKSQSRTDTNTQK